MSGRTSSLTAAVLCCAMVGCERGGGGEGKKNLARRRKMVVDYGRGERKRDVDRSRWQLLNEREKKREKQTQMEKDSSSL